jgi:hypothetical protein
MVAPQAQQRRIRMTFPRFEIPCDLLADRTRLKQALIIRLLTAITGKDGGYRLKSNHYQQARQRT